MAKSSRASAVKKNNQKLKKNVFGPIETARNERLSAKLLELASQPKPPRTTEMEIEQDQAKEEAKATEDVDVDMDADDPTKPATRSRQSSKRSKKSPRIEKKKFTRKRKNSIVFPTHPMKAKKRK